MELRGRGSLQAEKRHGVNQFKLNSVCRVDNRVHPALSYDLSSTADDLPGSVIPGKDVKHRREETCCNCNLAEAQR